MAQASDTLGILRQNLADAGCDKETIKSCITYAEGGEWDRLIPLLSAHKAALLKTAHESARQIDCLDYLVYHIKKEHKEEAI